MYKKGTYKSNIFIGYALCKLLSITPAGGMAIKKQLTQLHEANLYQHQTSRTEARQKVIPWSPGSGPEVQQLIQLYKSGIKVKVYLEV